MRNGLNAFGAVCLTAAIGAAQDGTPVADAAMAGDTETVRSLLRTGADVNTAHGDGMTPLHWASYKGDAEMAQILIYAGANPHALTRLGDYTPLILASTGGHAEVIGALLNAGADVNATTSSGAAPIHLAAAAGDADAVGALLDHGADVNATESVWEQTPLMFAASANRTEVIAELIERGADLAVASKMVPISETSARASAERRARNERVKALRDPLPAGGGGRGRFGGFQQAPPQAQRGAQAQGQRGRGQRGAAGNPDPQAGGQRSRGRRTGAAAAAGGSEPPAGGQRARGRRQRGQAAQAGGQRARGQRGGQRGGGRGQRGRGGQDPAAGQAQALRQVSGGGARDSGMGGRGGMTALLHASRQGHAEAVRLLLDAGADVNLVHGGDQSSPLMIATINGHFDLAIMLLERGADPNLPNNVGAAPLYGAVNVHWAPTAFYPQPSTKQEHATHLDLMAALLDAGAEPDSRLTGKVWYTGYNFDQSGENETGATPFWRAAQSADVDAMRLLVSRGADPELWNEVTRSFRRRGRRGASPAESTESAGVPSEVETFYQTALAERREALGDKHPATLSAIHDLAVLLQKNGKTAEAAPLLREAAEGRSEVLGEEHPATVASAQALESVGPTAEAAPAADQSVSEVSAAELRGEDPKEEEEPEDELPDLGPPTEPGGPATSALNMAAGAGFDGNFHVTAPYGRLPAVKYLVEELGFDVNGRDYRGYTALHHAAFRGDNELILYLVDQGADPLVVSRSGQTTVDMANGPIQRLQPFEDTIALLEGMGAKNNHRAVSR